MVVDLPRVGKTNGVWSRTSADKPWASYSAVPGHSYTLPPFESARTIEGTREDPAPLEVPSQWTCVCLCMNTVQTLTHMSILTCILSPHHTQIHTDAFTHAHSHSHILTHISRHLSTLCWVLNKDEPLTCGLSQWSVSCLWSSSLPLPLHSFHSLKGRLLGNTDDSDLASAFKELPSCWAVRLTSHFHTHHPRQGRSEQSVRSGLRR